MHWHYHLISHTPWIFKPTSEWTWSGAVGYVCGCFFFSECQWAFPTARNMAVFIYRMLVDLTFDLSHAFNTSKVKKIKKKERGGPCSIPISQLTPSCSAPLLWLLLKGKYCDWHDSASECSFAVSPSFLPLGFVQELNPLYTAAGKTGSSWELFYHVLFKKTEIKH